MLLYIGNIAWLPFQNVILTEIILWRFFLLLKMRFLSIQYKYRQPQFIHELLSPTDRSLSRKCCCCRRVIMFALHLRVVVPGHYSCCVTDKTELAACAYNTLVTLDFPAITTHQVDFFAQ